MPQAAQQEQQTFSNVTPISQTFTDVSSVSGGSGADNNSDVEKDAGFWNHVGSYLKAQAGTPPETFKDAVMHGLKQLDPRESVGGQIIKTLTGTIPQEFFGARERGHGIPYSTAAGASSAVGVRPEEMEKAAAKGDTSGVLGEAAVPTIMAAAPLITEGALKGGEAAKPAIRGGWRAIGNPFGLASTGQELLTQGISPRTSLLNFKPSLERAASDLKAYNEQSPINNVQDLHDAIPEIKQKIWSEEVEPALQRQADKPVKMQPVADAVRGQISDEMKTFDEPNAEKLEKLASKLEATKDVQGANKLLKYINGQLESYFQKFPAARKANLMNNPETAGWEAARAELRNQFLTTLEANGETGVRDARLRYGAFDTLQDAVERRVNVADRAKPMSLGRIVGMAAAPATGGVSLVAGELSNYLNKPDVLVRRGINNLPDVRETPFSPPSARNPLIALKSPGEAAPYTLKTDSLGVKWAETPSGIRVSVPKGMEAPEIVAKLKEQAEAQNALKVRLRGGQ